MKPYEAAIIFAYTQGYHSARSIVHLYNYKTQRPVEKVLLMYRNQLADIRKMSHKTRFISEGATKDVQFQP